MRVDRNGPRRCRAPLTLIALSVDVYSPSLAGYPARATNRPAWGLEATLREDALLGPTLVMRMIPHLNVVVPGALTAHTDGGVDFPEAARARRSPRRRVRSVCSSRVADDNFSLEFAPERGAVVIRVRGEIDLATSERLRGALEPHLGPEQTLIVDLSGVRFMDASSLAVLEHARGTVTANGGSLILRNPSRAARLLLTAAEAEYLLDDGERRPPG